MRNKINMKRKGFTLVELVVVILVIAILAAAIFLGGATVIKQARESQVKSDLRNMATYVQDMLYENPQLQYHSRYANGEHFTYDPTTKTFTYASETNAALADMEVMTKLLNEDYMTDDFQLGQVVDAWNNPYLFSYDQIVSDATGKASSCVIVINSLGVNTIDESSNGSGSNGVQVANIFDADMLADGAQKKYASAEEFVATIPGTNDTEDDYGVVIVMIDGQVSTAYYGF